MSEKLDRLQQQEREFFSQGYVFKDWDAFYHKPDAPCYVPELDDTVYTGADFRKLCGSQEEIAEEHLFVIAMSAKNRVMGVFDVPHGTSGIALLDHIIIGEQYYSFMEGGML